MASPTTLSTPETRIRRYSRYGLGQTNQPTNQPDVRMRLHVYTRNAYFEAVGVLWGRGVPAIMASLATAHGGLVCFCLI